MNAVAQFTTLFSGVNRLYALDGPGDVAALQIERWVGREALSERYAWDVYALAAAPDLDTRAMLGQRVTITTRLSDGSTMTRSGLVAEAECIGFDGALARYFLKLVPPIEPAVYGRDQRAWSNQTLDTILGAVLADYRSLGSWQFTGDAKRHIQALGPLDYVVQYRTHSNFDFCCHLLADAGLGFYFEEDPQGASAPTMVIFDDSTQLPEDATSIRLGGLPYRYSGSMAEAPNQILFMGQARRLMADRITILSPDLRTDQSVTASASLGNAPAGHRELYDDVGPDMFTDSRQAQETARRQAQAVIAQSRTWNGDSTLPTARAGYAFQTPDAPWVRQAGSNDTPPQAFLLTEVHHVGINNLPQTVMASLERNLGPLPMKDIEPRLLKIAKEQGYANHFHAVPRTQVWRPTLADGTGQRLNPVATTLGVQTAIVAGAEGETTPGGSTGPVYIDAQQRVRLIYHWQAEGDRNTYPTRFVQRLASDGHGAQFNPHIGQELLVSHLHGLANRPIALGGLYNGRGEGGTTPTPGGVAGEPVNTEVFAQATDHSASAQGNLTSGNSPAWHGAGAGTDNHGHAAALSGFKTQGFDGQGYNQLVIRDTDNAGQLQMATTHGATQVNLGILRHQAGNYVGTFRGRGIDIRSDLYGAVHGERGVLLNTFSASQSQPMGEVSGVKALLTAQITLAKTLDKAAEIHLTLPLAAQRGVQKADQSRLNGKAAPLEALQQSFATTVSGESFQQGIADAPSHATDKALPHTGDAVLGIAAQGPQGIVAGEALQWAVGETFTIGSGKDFNLAVAHQLRIHSGQGIGWLAGASQAHGGVGLSLISGKDNLDIQAQHETLALRSRDDLKIAAINGMLDMAAGKTIHMAVSGGAAMTMEGGNLTFLAPGNIVAYAAIHDFLDAAQMDPKFSQPGDPKGGDYGKAFSD